MDEAYCAQAEAFQVSLQMEFIAIINSTSGN